MDHQHQSVSTEGPLNGATALIDHPHLPVSSSPWPRAKLTSLILALTTLSADLDSVLNSNDSTNGGC